MSELKPCPFCGGEAHIVKDFGEYRVLCLLVDCKVNPISHYRETEKEAIEAWNTRAKQTCEGCKHEGKSSLVEPCYSCTHVNYNDCYEVVSE